MGSFKHWGSPYIPVKTIEDALEVGYSDIIDVEHIDIEKPKPKEIENKKE